VLAAIPFCAKRIPRKGFLLIGLAAYAVRMGLYVYARDLPSPLFMAILGTALHGFCFGCFIFVAFMIVDEETTPDVRASAQSLFNLVIVGVGIIVGSKIATGVAEWAAGGPTPNYSNPDHVKPLFSVPMWAAVACFAVILLFYPRRGTKHS
ncbi:MAG: MFS transporter, partial [Planctomycetota bacterium]|nr:MFS transporter [Planctomycetota bacterium]